MSYTEYAEVSQNGKSMSGNSVNSQISQRLLIEDESELGRTLQQPKLVEHVVAKSKRGKKKTVALSNCWMYRAPEWLIRRWLRTTWEISSRRKFGGLGESSFLAMTKKKINSFLKHTFSSNIVLEFAAKGKKEGRGFHVDGGWRTYRQYISYSSSLYIWRTVTTTWRGEGKLAGGIWSSHKIHTKYRHTNIEMKSVQSVKQSAEIPQRYFLFVYTERESHLVSIRLRYITLID